MSRIRFPYHKENTRRHYSVGDNRDFVTGSSRNSIDMGQAAQEPDSTNREAGAGGGRSDGGGGARSLAGNRSDGTADAIAPAILEALAGRRPARTPVWFMRQAGRSLPEYRALRERAGVPMLEACLNPGLAAEATLQPVRRHGVDAAVFFSDIMVPLRLAGVGVRIEEGVGPVLDAPVRSVGEVTELVAHRFGDTAGAEHTGGTADAEGVAAIEKAVRRVVVELGSPQAPGVREGLSERARAGLEHSAGPAGWTPVLAFGGAPFTLAAYLVEGRPSRDHLAARTLMRSDPQAWEKLMTWCARLTGEFIATQVRAGAAAAQLFDSWAGSLSPHIYRERVAPYSALALETARQALSPTTGRTAPLIHFGTGTARLLGLMRQAGADAVGIDERIELSEAIQVLADADPKAGACPVQGNLDPALLAAPWPLVAQELDAVLAAGGEAPGHVVNLGHGVPPTTDADVLTRIVARVHGSADWESAALAGWDAVADTASGAGSSAGSPPRGANASGTAQTADGEHGDRRQDRQIPRQVPRQVPGRQALRDTGGQPLTRTTRTPGQEER